MNTNQTTLKQKIDKTKFGGMKDNVLEDNE